MNATSGLARRLCALAMLTAAGGLLASACADNESSLFVRMRMARTGDCTVTCSPDEEFWTADSVDSAYRNSHSATLLVGNQIVRRGDSDVLRTETSRVQLYEAEVRITDIAGNPVEGADGASGYVVPVTGIVDPGSSDEAGYNCTEVLLIDGATMDVLRDQARASGRPVEVISTVLVRGRTLGGQEVETAEWSYPIQVCFNCSACINTDPPDCCNPATAENDPDACGDVDKEIVGSCSGQVGVVDCRTLGKSCGDYLAER
ncbi:hypothetical protein SOCEGT47_075420 [Sorangium cellulosum]|uniref:Secreted protein n=1 Tax=Sorangium cellulosum TaxID=56 RepID=A0A4P2QBA5_SORCE|nr:hypothetical protein [Sorangium cellulosum]AUX26970.1 hypothetical protein SOCEGT47_075420 [Sorangium cellulosum]